MGTQPADHHQPAPEEPTLSAAGNPPAAGHQGAAGPSETQPASPPGQGPDVARLQDQLRRALADLDNLRKRHARELARERLADRAQAAQAWLPVVDNLELALQHAGEQGGGLAEGVRAVHQQAVEAMARLGFPRFDADGAAFDPSVHEAVSSIPDETRAGTVVATARPGYGTREALLRPAGVVVAVAPRAAP